VSSVVRAVACRPRLAGGLGSRQSRGLVAIVGPATDGYCSQDNANFHPPDHASDAHLFIFIPMFALHPL
jgi:hypothetical protein